MAQMKEAIATHATSAAAKLRQQQQNTTAITIFILTSRFKDNYSLGARTHAEVSSAGSHRYFNSITLIIQIAICWAS
ncbi:MAG: hypothetical protein AAF383_11760 [Cyanobacteria bacterium P01_A01_bin.83]